MAQKTHVEIYKDKKGQSRWRIKRGGRTVADSSEGYQKAASCRSSITNIILSFAAGDYVVTILPPPAKKPCKS